MTLLAWVGLWVSVSLVSALAWVALVSASRRTGPRLTAESVRAHAEHDRAAHPTVVPFGPAGASSDHAA